jgi:hypothetical protein
MFWRVMVSMSSPMALRVVAMVWGNSGWEFDFRQMGRVDKEARNTLWLVAGLLVDILMLDIVWVVVVLAVEVTAVVLMFQRVSVSWMTVSSRGKIMKFVGGVRWVANQVL